MIDSFVAKAAWNNDPGCIQKTKQPPVDLLFAGLAN